MDNTIYKHIIQSSSFGYTYNELIFDEKGTPVDYVFRDANPAYAALLGIPLSDLIGKRVSEILPNFFNDPFNWLERFASVAITGKQTEFDAFSESLNRYFHLSVSTPGKGFFVVLSFDINESKLISEKLDREEDDRRQYFDHAPDGMFITDKYFKYIEVNNAACAMMGYTREELLELHISDLIPTEDKPIHSMTMNRLVSEGKSRRIGKLRRKDGSLISVLMDAIRLQNGRLLALCKDMSEQDKIETEKNQYHLAFQSTAQPILITDAEGTILSVNDSFVEMYGYTREELINETPHLLNPGKEVYENLGVSLMEYEAKFKNLWDAVRDPNIRTWTGEMINKKKNSSLVWINLIVNALYDDENKLSSIIGLPIDMTPSHDAAMSNRILLFTTLADLAELRDDDTGNHMKRVGLFAKILAREYGRNQKYCDDIEIFAPMHDIGKVGILDSILRAPRKLTTEEFEIMKTHTVLGHNIVKGKLEFEMAAAITLCHHERFDGTGYPNGVSGKNIPLSAHITALADVYDALRSKRPYKNPWTHERTLNYIIKSSGTHFDPDLVRLLVRLQERFAAVYQELSDPE